MRKLPIATAIKRIKYLGMQLTRDVKGPLQGKLKTTVPGNKRGHTQMENHSILMVRKNKYRENGHTAKVIYRSMLFPSSYQ